MMCLMIANGEVTSPETGSPADKSEPGSRVCVVSYSHTGNNAALADAVASALGAEHRRIEERRPRGMRRILLDVLFKRQPKAGCRLDGMEQFEVVLFVAPVRVDHTYVHGKAVVRDGRLVGLDERRLVTEHNAAAKRLVEG